MIYNNLIYFLVVIVLFSASNQATPPFVDAFTAMVLVPLLFSVFYLIAKKLYNIGPFYQSKRYFRAEKLCSIIAVLFFSLLVYVVGIKYYLSPFSLGDRFPSIVNSLGLCVFFIFLSLMWAVARRAYIGVFGRHHSNKNFIISNIKANLPLALPWLLISLSYDLLLLIPNQALKDAISTGWGDFLFFLFFLLIIIIFSPPIIRRLWGCTRLPEGELRTKIEAFCETQNFSAEIFLWPLFEGRVITAGVMGILPRFRYLLLTPAIIEAMDHEELESILAHEIGHVKKYHLPLYVVIISSFSLWMTFFSEPAMRLLFSRDFFIDFMVKFNISPSTMYMYLGTFMVLICLVLFFRFIFGFFIRNFERQADLHVFTAIGSAEYIKSAFEKIAALSGNIRDKPSWHHFGIGERVAYLEKCETDPSNIAKQNHKVIVTLVIYLLLVALTVMAAGKIPTDNFIEQYENKYMDAYYVDKVKNGSDNLLTLRQAAHYMLLKQQEELALSAYTQALALAPDNADLLNNSAWLMVAGQDLSLRNPAKALVLAKKAASFETEGYILDTLATAYWANDMTAQAVETERFAIKVDSEQSLYYMQQAARFQTITYEENIQNIQNKRNKS